LTGAAGRDRCRGTGRVRAPKSTAPQTARPTPWSMLAAATKGEFGPAGRERISPEAFYWEIRPWFNGVFDLNRRRFSLGLSLG
jgi:hypothetical protein